MKRLHWMFLAVLALVASLAFVQVDDTSSDVAYTLTVLHNNDGESQLVNAGVGLEDFGGVARFARQVSNLRAEAAPNDADRGVVVLSSGDNFLAGPEFNASQGRLDAVALRAVGYDALAIGNHEFDFGPDVLADFIGGFQGTTQFVSANLDFTGEPALQTFVDQNVIVASTIVAEGNENIGIVGATTPRLPYISSPRNVAVNPDVVGTVQAQIDTLTASGVDIIIMISHLQSVSEDLDLAPQLSGVDIMIAGGGDELLANADTVLVPGDDAPFGPYPLYATGADGASVPVVTTPGEYKYVGRLVVDFDAEGNVLGVGDESDLVRVAGGDNPDAVEPDPGVQADVVVPVNDAVTRLAQNVIGTSSVELEGRRSPGVRTMETNEGSLMADALFWQATLLAVRYRVVAPDVALQNGGGIRNNTLIPPGDITQLTTFDIAPFANFVVIVPDVPAAQFLAIMENAVSQVENADGRFAQIAGFSMVYNPAAPAGSRVVSITLDDGTPIVSDGALVADAPAVNVATIDFLARGGDEYPFADAPYSSLGVTYQQALENYITSDLGGSINADNYPEGGLGRIVP
jgi:2',3'-cyclic-nucleotide 2'-phosphodiesterase (5'-nucleotidase family)